MITGHAAGTADDNAAFGAGRTAELVICWVFVVVRNE